MHRLMYIGAACCMLRTVHTEPAIALREDKPKPDSIVPCKNCVQPHIVSVDEDFSKLKVDPEVNKHVREILTRLKTFKIPVHPRIRIFYELLKIAMNGYAHRTADSLYVPDKYNVVKTGNNKNNNHNNNA